MHKELEYSSAKDARPQPAWKILFLDGAKNIARLKVTCKADGHTVLGAHTIEEAWALLDSENQVDVIVCAAHLEEGSMFQFLQDVRDNEVHRKVKFLILSLAPGAIGERLHGSTASAGLALGADAYAIMAVFDPDELIALIKRLEPPVPMRQQSGASEKEHRA